MSCLDSIIMYVCVCACNWVFTDVYQSSDMIIYVWGPTFYVSVSNMRPSLNQFVTAIVSWITGARHNAL